MKQKIAFVFLSYLRFFARLQLAKIKYLNPNLKIVGITGSAGKTSTMLATESALKPEYRVKTNYGGNSESGIPLSILGLTVGNYTFVDWLKIVFLTPLSLIFNWKIYDVFLIEMGIDGPRPPKNMDYLLTIVKPDIGIFLNVSPVHQMNFASLDQIALEKSKLLKAASISITNLSDPLVRKYSPNQSINITPQNIKLENYLLPSIYQISFGASLAVAQALGLSKDKSITNIINNFHLPPGRSTMLKGINQSTIIDSSYNSSPLATEELLKFLLSFPSPRIAILGDMRELGFASQKFHEQIYQTALKSSNIIISVGKETKKYFGSKAIKFDYWWQASEYLKNQPELIKKSTILVKGSQNTIFLEELVKELLYSKKDSSLLCRQSPYWIKQKQIFRRQND